MPGALAQPPQPQDQEDGLDRGGGPYHLPGAPPVRQPMGAHRQAAAGPHGQRNKEPLELHHAPQVRGGDAWRDGGARERAGRGPRRTLCPRAGPRSVPPGPRQPNCPHGPHPHGHQAGRRVPSLLHRRGP